MIRKMKWKFIAFVMACIAVLMAIVVGGINFFARIQMTEHYDQLLDILVENGGEFSSDGWNKDKVNNDGDGNSRNNYSRIFRYDLKITKETPFENRYFFVFFDENGNIIGENVEHISAVSEDTAHEYAQSVLELNSEIGSYDTYRYLVADGDNGKMVGFMDMYQHIQNLYYTIARLDQDLDFVVQQRDYKSYIQLV